MKTKRASGVLIYFVCKYSEEDLQVSRDKLTDDYQGRCCLQNYQTCVVHPWEAHTLSLTREVWTTEDASQKFAVLGIEKHAQT